MPVLINCAFFLHFSILSLYAGYKSIYDRKIIGKKRDLGKSRGFAVISRNFTRYIINKAVDRALHEMKQEKHVKRELRNIVELGLFHSKESYHRNFFSSVQQMLTDEQSPYYSLAFGAAEHINAHMLKTFGVNIGYNAWTIGAQRIREYERYAGCSVPWAIQFDFSGHSANPLTLQEISGIIAQGRELGIYSFFFLCGGDSRDVWGWIGDLMSRFSDCVFVLFAKAQDIRPLDCSVFLEAGNGMPVVAYAPGEEDYQAVVGRFRKKRCLYSIYLEYGQKGVQQLLDSYTAQAQVMPPVTFLLRRNPCGEEDAAQMQDFVEAVRLQPQYPTFFVDFYRDVARVGSIISNDSSLLTIDGGGGVFITPGGTPAADIRRYELSALLKSLFPNPIACT